MKPLSVFCFLFLFPIIAHPYTRTDGLPKGFVWSYLPDERSSQPRGGIAWRAGLIDGDSIFLLSTDTLAALDKKGAVQWVYRFPAEGMNSEAKIIPLGADALIAATTDALIKIDRKTGALLKEYSYDTSKRSAFQRTLLLPRYTFLYGNNIYGFIGPSLIRLDSDTFQREEAAQFSSSPKTLPVLYRNKIAVGLENGFFELFDPESGKTETLISGSPKKDFRLRQPAVRGDLLFVPATDELLVYQGTEIFARNTSLTNALLSVAGGRVWMRGHNTGILSEIDETLSILKEGRYASPLRAGVIDAPLAGSAERLLHLESLNGALTIIDVSGAAPSVKSTLVSEDFAENPPLRLLGAQNNLVLIGGFDGVFLIDLSLF